MYRCPGVLQRSSFTTRKGVNKTLLIVRRCPTKFSIFATTCSNMHMHNDICLTSAGRFPIKWARRQSITVEEECVFFFFFFFCMPREISKETLIDIFTWTVEEIQFYTVFSLSACPKARADSVLGVELERVPTSVCKFNLAFESTIDICDWSTTSACVHQLLWRSENDSKHFWGEIWLCKHRSAKSFFFFFFFCCRSHNELGPNPLPPIWKFFRLSATCEILRWPLTEVWTVNILHHAVDVVTH